MPDLIAVSPTPDPVPPAFSLADRDEYGPILGRPGGLFTAPPVTAEIAPIATDPGRFGRPAASWVPAEHLL